MRSRSIPLLLAASLLAACGNDCPACPEPTPDEEASAGGEDEGVCLEAEGPEAREAEIRALAEAPRRQAPPGTATVALLARGRNAFVGRLEMEPGAAVPEHADADEEYIVILEGSGEMTIDGETRAVSAGDTIFMPANARVSFRNGDAPMVALQVFAGPASAAKYDRWTPVEAAAE